MNKNKSLLANKPDYMVCTCMAVMHSEIIQAFTQGDLTIAALKDRFGVGTGCSSCLSEINDLINDFSKNNKNE